MKILKKTMKIHEHLEESMKIMNMHLFSQKKKCDILYSKNINASHICPPKRNRLLKQRQRKWRFLGTH